MYIYTYILIEKLEVGIRFRRSNRLCYQAMSSIRTLHLDYFFLFLGRHIYGDRSLAQVIKLVQQNGLIYNTYGIHH